jgi:hypothetical protein
MYESVEQLIESSNQKDKELIEVNNQLEDDEEEINEEFEEILVENKNYYVKDKIIYNKNKNDSIGNECGKITKNGKVKFNKMVN